jgi:aminopeptidase N
MLSDAKGHWMYHMLRARVGDEVFFDVLRKLIRDGAEHGLSVEILRRAFVASAPKADLDRFFVEWLEHPGAPVIELDWNAAIDSGSKASTAEIEVRLRQVQEGELYHLPIELEIETAAGPCRRAVELDEREGHFVLATPARATRVRLDPDSHLLMWRPEYGPRPGASSLAK